MVSMIDIVFLLLIFFLVTTSYIRPELRLPSAIAALPDLKGASSASDLEPATIDIVSAGDRFQFRLGQIETADLGRIEQVLRTFRNRDAGAFVRADDGAPFDLPARAIHVCRELGFNPVTYLPLD